MPVRNAITAAAEFGSGFVGAGVIALAVVGIFGPTANTYEQMITSPRPCAEGPRLYETDRAAYERQARRVFRAWGVSFSNRHNYELDHRVPRCLGGSDTDDNLWPQPLAEAVIKDRLEREVCNLVCRRHTLSLQDGVGMFDDWKAGYLTVFGDEPRWENSP